jgi:hypothetical protein
MTAGIGAADAAIYTGVCLENVDPLGLGRIRYAVPQLSGTQSFGWATPIYPGVTAVGATIYVAFEGGDRNRPLFWPDQIVPPAPISYPTFAAMSAANPISTTPPGTEYYVVDHGGSVQLQNTGLTSGLLAWQWLPSGYQSSGTNASDAAASGTTASLVAYAAIDNPSVKRQYQVAIDSQVWTSSGGGPLAGLGITTSTSAPAATLPAFGGAFTVSRAASVGLNSAGVSAGSAVSLAYSHVLTGLAAGAVWISVYIMNNYGNGNTVTTSAGTTQVVVSDIGAVT